MACGHAHRRRLRIMCDLDPEEFERINAAKVPGCRSMSAKLRVLIEWGLMVLEDDERENA